MKFKHYVIPAIIGFSIGGTAVTYADSSHHPGAATTGAQASGTQGKGMMDADKMQARMKEMQATMVRIHKATDPAERERLMQEHMKQMHEMMGDMHGMMGAGMMAGAGMKGGDGKGKEMPMTDQQGMMEKRLDMMQGMMEQMMEQMMAKEAMPGMDGKDKGMGMGKDKRDNK